GCTHSDVACATTYRQEILRRDCSLPRVHPQVGHGGRRALMLWIAHPVIDPLLGLRVAYVLERLAERPARTERRSLAFADDVAALAADRLDDLLAVLRVSTRRCFDGELVLLGVRE